MAVMILYREAPPNSAMPIIDRLNNTNLAIKPLCIMFRVLISEHNCVTYLEHLFSQLFQQTVVLF